MHSQFSDNMWKIMTCPSCGKHLEKTSQGALCSNCKLGYEYTKTGSLDLRLKNPKSFLFGFKLGTSLFPKEEFNFDKLIQNHAHQVDFSKIAVPWHLTKEIMSYFPKAISEKSLMLDLGCGDTIHRDVCQHCGFEYVGLDYDSEKASILGDAHALPFKDESFEFILSIAVLEHIRYPFVMMKEAYRVLKPNGMFIGTVAFLEPFHGNSFYHHTHLGTYNSLKEGGFEIEHVAPSEKWSVLVAQARMGLFPKMPIFFAKMLVFPVLFLHRLWWKIGSKLNPKASEKTRILLTTGAFTFIARR
jgi:ubiquinone/menaquinone biosynthesis C-methylase UbiE